MRASSHPTGRHWSPAKGVAGGTAGLTHRSYESVGGDIRVEIYAGRLVVSNPGQLPEGWTPQDLKREHRSIPFNPGIARVFFLRGMMDRLGVGTQRLIRECRQSGAKSPSWRVERDTVSLTLYRTPEPEIEELLPDRQARFLSNLDCGADFRTSDYADAMSVSERQARRGLSELVTRGVVERRGRGPATTYRRVPKGG